MKNLIILSILLILGVGANAQCCSGKTSESKENCSQSAISKSETAVTTYYFHATRRCETCLAVESVSKEALQEYYGSKVEFISINSDDKQSEQLVQKFKVSGPALLVVKGDEVVDLTAVAFMNALSTPDKLKEKLKSSIDPLI